MSAAVGPSLRTVMSTPAIAVAPLAALPAVVTIVHGGQDLRGATVAAALLSGAAYGFAVDDPAAATLAASPSPVRNRLALRVLAVTITVAAAWLVIAVCAWLTSAPLGPLGPRAAEGAAAAGLAITAARWGPRSAPPDGLRGAIVAIVVPLAITVVARSHQLLLPTLGRPDHATGWWAMAAITWLGAWWATRDPAAVRAGRRHARIGAGVHRRKAPRPASR
jgi:hypothetical protein